MNFAIQCKGLVTNISEQMVRVELVGMPYCELTGKEWLAGGRVSHSHVRTHRKFKANIRAVRLSSDILSKEFRLQIAVSTQRTVDRCGSLDNFLLSRRDAELSDKALGMKKLVMLKLVQLELDALAMDVAKE